MDEARRWMRRGGWGSVRVRGIGARAVACARAATGAGSVLVRGRWAGGSGLVGGAAAGAGGRSWWPSPASGRAARSGVAEREGSREVAREAAREAAREGLSDRTIITPSWPLPPLVPPPPSEGVSHGCLSACSAVMRFLGAMASRLCTSPFAASTCSTEYRERAGGVS